MGCCGGRPKRNLTSTEAKGNQPSIDDLCESRKDGDRSITRECTEVPPCGSPPIPTIGLVAGKAATRGERQLWIEPPGFGTTARRSGIGAKAVPQGSNSSAPRDPVGKPLDLALLRLPLRLIGLLDAEAVDHLRSEYSQSGRELSQFASVGSQLPSGGRSCLLGSTGSSPGTWERSRATYFALLQLFLSSGSSADRSAAQLFGEVLLFSRDDRAEPENTRGVALVE